jgi:CRISPR-associated protein Cmr2
MRFAVHQVPGIVKEHHGELIYSGGDDVLALLPTETALACTLELRNTYPKEWPESLRTETAPTVSAGIAVVHYKEDLRLALEAARRAEKAAKNAGRDALGLSILRRSGEHTLALLDWKAAQPLQQLVDVFVAKATDRWTYTLYREMPSLVGDEIPDGLFEAELKRLLNRVEGGTHKVDLRRVAEKLLTVYEDSMRGEKRKWSRKQTCEGFVTICQSAAFLARGTDLR